MTDEQSTAAPPPLAARYGLVRPVQGRYVAGVAAALGRATRTDPVLWRVVLAVLICFAGLGVLAYLLVWLLTPEEGDTASPLESLLGRGYSNTSPVLTALLGLATVGLLAIVLPRPFYLVLTAALVLGFLLLLNRARTGAPATPPPAAPAPEPPNPPPPAPPPGAVPVPPPPPRGGPAPAWGPAGPAPAGYRPPFAPHGPFAGAPLPPPPPPPRPPRERSSLPALVLFTGLLLLGMLGALHLAGLLAVPAAGYVAAALAVVGGGLLIGAWVGRARVLIVLGALLALALPLAHAMDTWDRPEYLGDQFTWIPQTPAELDDEYDLAFGSGVLDLRQLDFSGRDEEVVIRVSFGEMRVLLPEDVAVEATVDNRFGEARVFGERTEGVTRESLRDPGSGDPADGTLRLDLHVRFGELEVGQ